MSVQSIIDINLEKMLLERKYTRPTSSFDSKHTRSHEDDIWLNSDKIVKILKEDSNIGVDHTSNLKNMMNKNNIDHVIIVLAGNISPAASSALSELRLSYTIEIFSIEDLSFDLLKFIDIKYSALTEQETRDLLKSYRTKKFQFPKLLFDDPVRKYYGWKKGTIIREREGENISYRVVC